jgi:transposase
VVSQEGEKALRAAGRAGRKRRLDEKQRQRLVARLLEGPEKLGYETPLWTCERVAHLIEQEFGVRYHAGHVWKLLRQLNWSPQRPAGRALERNEEAIGEWKRKTWPAIKKKPKKKAARSSSSTKAD